MRLKKWISTFVFIFAMTLLLSPAFAQGQQIVISPVPSVSIIDDNIKQLNLAIDKINELIDYRTLYYPVPNPYVSPLFTEQSLENIQDHINNIWSSGWVLYASDPNNKIIDKSTDDLNPAMTSLFSLNFKDITDDIHSFNDLNSAESAKTVMINAKHALAYYQYVVRK